MILKPRPFRKPRLGLPICRGLVGLWIFNEGSGNKVFDLSGNGNTVTLVNDVSWTSGKFGSALKFPGEQTNHLELLGLPPAFSAFSIRFTFEGDGGTAGLIYCGTSLYINANTTLTVRHADIGDGTTAKAIPSVVTGWHTVTFTWDGANTAVYADGIGYGGEVATGTMTMPQWYIGRGGGTADFAGKLSDLMIYNRSLSASEIALLYREPFCMFEREPIELWTAAMSGGAPPANAMPVAMDYYRRLRVA